MVSRHLTLRRHNPEDHDFNSHHTENRLVSCRASSSSANQEIPRLLWKPKEHCFVGRSPPLVPILKQMTPVSSLI